ncbi:MAG: RluA family pseudouridine synthase [Thermoguttaceae bacterium]
MAKRETNLPEQIFRVLPRQAGETIGAALREWLPGESWSQVRKLIESRRVMLSGNLCVDPARRLKLQDVVKILPQPMAAPPTEAEIRIVYLDAHVVVVEKPAGITSTRHKEEKNWPNRRKQLQPTLDEMLPAVIARQEGRRAKSKLPPVRAVHRLDRDTSGLMVFARTPAAQKHLEQQFRKHTTGRCYLAIAHGDVKERIIESRLVRDRGDGIRGSTTLPNTGKHSLTHVRPIEKLGDYTLVECRPETGRTHQIRIHLAEIGHPLCGEKIYLQPLFRQPVKDASGAPRLALSAVELTFKHPITGESMHFKSPLPADLRQFIKTLRKGG